MNDLIISGNTKDNYYKYVNYYVPCGLKCYPITQISMFQAGIDSETRVVGAVVGSDHWSEFTKQYGDKITKMLLRKAPIAHYNQLMYFMETQDIDVIGERIYDVLAQSMATIHMN